MSCWVGGDWMCGACQHQNFKKREACQRCGYPKYGGPDVSTYLYNNSYNSAEVLAGDWYCSAMNCGVVNYASRTNCYRCGSLKNDFVGNYNTMGCDGTVPPGWKTGDWNCTRYGCGVHNYASRIECFKCKTPRNFGNIYIANNTGKTI
ncbi:hypothetical protein E1A91_D13G239200v1 [Gossypium mustelinum]|uniref:RanBP2-type domain-containing protein n=1 Tax=Gossypium mustelinum TaxID=34275 RepID=A0A5D2S9D4_GOSMU|nr:hypothetical protein E1A91_D13G239200v1 [Gossypium mustelinum]